MYKNIHNFVPFQHDNQDFKNKLIGFARNQDKIKIEGVFTATLIYTNLVDYLATNLFDNLNKMLSIFTFKKFGGVFHLDTSQKRTHLSVGELQRELSYFEFPNRNDFLACLEEFRRLRNEVMHNLMGVDPNDTTMKLDKGLARIAEISEDILAKYNVICAGLITIWNNANA
ncbi:MAG: hypothetical protein ABR875_00360 [Minisyncoccia bacterium]|jgi:uncharacterized protein with HEPN domain